ncbi:MAG: shikimate kinase [Acidimicrobiales bacterium]
MTDLDEGGPRRHVALIGLMGSGKTTVGRLLAERSHRPLVDTDSLVEAATGQSVAELFGGEGEAAFRRYELDCLARALARSEPSIVATGGGIVLTDAARNLLRRDATVVWLRAAPSTLAARLGDDITRPLLADRDPVDVLTDLETRRSVLYDEVADVVVDADGPDPVDVADRVAAVLGWTS